MNGGVGNTILHPWLLWRKAMCPCRVGVNGVVMQHFYSRFLFIALKVWGVVAILKAYKTNIRTL